MYGTTAKDYMNMIWRNKIWNSKNIIKNNRSEEAQARFSISKKEILDHQRLDLILKSQGVQIEFYVNTESKFRIEHGTHSLLLANTDSEISRFYDLLLGYSKSEFSQLKINSEENFDLSHLRNITSVLGRPNLIYGETLQDLLQYRTRDYRKANLHYLCENIYGNELKNKVSPQNPLINSCLLPVKIHELTEKELMEATEVNSMLMESSLVLVDTSTDFFKNALKQGYQISKLLADSSKTILFLGLESESENIENNLKFNFNSTIRL